MYILIILHKLYLPSSLLLVYTSGDDPAWFSDCLSSIVEQSVLPDDIVLILNSSELLPSHSCILDPLKHHINLFCIHNIQSFSTALNIGLSRCKYDIVFRFDPDDIIINNRFQVQYRFILENPLVDICGSYAYSFVSSNEITLISPPQSHSDITKQIYLNPLIHPSVCFRRSRLMLLQNYRLLPRAQDYDLWLRAYAHNFTFANIPIPLIKYRLPSQASKKTFSSCFIQSCILLRNILKFQLPTWWIVFSLLFLFKPLFPFTLWRRLKNFYERTLS